MTEETIRRTNYLQYHEMNLTGDGVYDNNGRRITIWSGWGRDKMTFEQAWERLMECNGLPLDWNPPLFWERFTCEGCRGNRDEKRVSIPQPRRRRWSSVPHL